MVPRSVTFGTSGSGDGSASPSAVFRTTVAAFALAVSVPLLDLLRQNAAFFIAHDSHPLEMTLFAVLAALLIPAAIAGIVWALRPEWLRTSVHFVVLAVLLSSFVAQLLERFIFDSPLSSGLLGLCGLIGTAGAFAINRYQGIGLYFRYLAWAPVAVLGLFFISPGVRSTLARESASGHSSEVHGAQTVVMVVFDELSAFSIMSPGGQINAERFPNFARLAEITTWFRDASTASNATLDAIPSLLSGRYPGQRALPIFNDHPKNLFTLLGGRHEVVASEPMTQLCPARLCAPSYSGFVVDRFRRLVSDGVVVAMHVALPEALSGWLPPIDDRWASFGDVPDRGQFIDEVITPQLRADRLSVFHDFVSAINAPERPTLYFHHALVPHRPWRYLPDGSTYDAVEWVPGQTSSIWSDMEWLVDMGLQRHLLQAGVADLMIGALLDRLDELTLLEDVILVVTSDHGVAFDPGKPMRHLDPITTGTILSVPLFMSIPGQEGEIVDDPVELVDVLPTIADLLQATTESWDFDGQSLLGPRVDEPRLVFTYEGSSPIEDLASNRAAALARFDARVPMSGGWETLYKAGAQGHLIGDPIGSLDVGAPGPWEVTLNNGDDLRQVSRGSADLPVYMTGWLTGPAVPDDGLDLVVVVNGVISAVTRTFDREKPSMFVAMIPDTQLSEGSNEVEIYVQEEPGIWSPLPMRRPPAE